jgi:large subunit ribosomal protein L23
MSNLHVTLIPRQSEKAYALSQTGVYVFKAPLTANKHQIASAVTDQFQVKVVDVNVVVSKGKVVRGVRKGKSVTGKRADFKKAYVRLAEGESIKTLDENAEETK